MMQENPTPDFPLPYMSEQQPPKKARQRYRHLVWACATVGLVLVAAVSTYLLMSKPAASNAPMIRSVTYYYRDGKTVLWQGARLAEADSPTVVHAVADALLDRYGETAMKQKGEWKIVTTIDQSLQQAAKQQVDAQREQLSRQQAKDAALIAQDVATGQIVSWVGSLDDRVSTEGEDRLNTRTHTGTLALPLVYATYIDNNTSIGAESVVEDIQAPLPGFPCKNSALPRQGGDCLQNYDRKYLGPMTLRQALGGQRLVPVVKAMTSMIPNDTSPGSVASINATISGIESMMNNTHGYSCFERGPDGVVADMTQYNEIQCYGASAMGDGVYATPSDVLNAFSTLSNKGKSLPQAYWLRVDLDGKMVDEWKTPVGRQAIKADAAYTISDILSDPSSSYLSKKSYFTTDNKTRVSTMTGVTYDAITVGAVQYTDKYAVGFWAFGNPIKGFGETITLPATHGWLTAAQ